MAQNSIFKYWLLSVGVLASGLGLSACAVGVKLGGAQAEMARPYSSEDMYQVLAAESLAAGGDSLKAASIYDRLYKKAPQSGYAKRAFQLYVSASDYPRASAMARAWVESGIEADQAFWVVKAMARMAQVTHEVDDLQSVVLALQGGFKAPSTYMAFVQSLVESLEPKDAMVLLQGLSQSMKEEDWRFHLNLLLSEKAMAANEWKIARAALDEAGREDESAVRFNRALILMHESEWQKAIERLTPLLSRKGWEESGRLRLARVYEQMQNWTQAMAVLQGIEPEGQAYWEAQKRIVSLMIKANRPGEALTKLERLEAHFPQQASVILRAKAELQSAMGHHQAALASFESI